MLAMDSNFHSATGTSALSGGAPLGTYTCVFTRNPVVTSCCALFPGLITAPRNGNRLVMKADVVPVEGYGANNAYFQRIEVPKVRTSVRHWLWHLTAHA